MYMAGRTLCHNADKLQPMVGTYIIMTSAVLVKSNLQHAYFQSTHKTLHLCHGRFDPFGTM